MFFLLLSLNSKAFPILLPPLPPPPPPPPPCCCCWDDPFPYEDPILDEDLLDEDLLDEEIDFLFEPLSPEPRFLQ